MAKRMTADIRVAVTPDLRARLEKEALRHRRSLSNLVRVLLEQALHASEGTPDPLRSEYDIRLTPKEVAHLEGRGYGLTADE